MDSCCLSYACRGGLALVNHSRQSTSANLVSRVKAVFANAFTMPTLATAVA